ncbi:MAG: hypothetical protein IJS56_04365 [Bacilli bacterium]|nr:hypothetical protein [Bacilli bacterium]
METFINFIKDFEGIFGAILGSATTLIITDILHKKGRLKFYLMDYNGEYWYESKEKHYGPTKDKKYGQEIESYRFQFTLDIYNTSELPKIMRDLKIEVYENKKLLTSIPVNDEETRRIVSRCITVDQTTVFNFNGKETVNIILSAEIPKEFAGQLTNKNIFLKLNYKNEKNKNKYFKIYKGAIEEE